MLSKLEKFLDGKKTYGVMILTALASIWTALAGIDPTHFHAIPEWVWTLLAACGLGAIRSSIGNGKPPAPPVKPI